MNKIGILNTSIATENTGDSIIMESSLRELEPITRNWQSFQFPTHEKISRKTYNIQSSISFNIACGTNLLHSHMGLVKQWNIGLVDSFYLKPVVLLGVGWRSQKKREPDFYTKWLLNRVLSGDLMHSVRDSYTKKQLNKCGFENVLNTGCPTIWMLNPDHCKTIPTSKGQDAVITLTDYSRNIDLDTAFIKYVSSNYRKVYFWPQGSNDIEYFNILDVNKDITILAPSLTAYNKLLSDDELSLDYIGTRLHGGIKALQKSRRSTIIGVDHRANEMGIDFSLPVIDRYDPLEKLFNSISIEQPTKIQIPHAEIVDWKNQFSSERNDE